MSGRSAASAVVVMCLVQGGLIAAPKAASRPPRVTSRPVAGRPPISPTSRPVVATRSATVSPATQEVTFTTEDNLVIHAGYTPAPRGVEKAPVAILVHMYRSDRQAFAPLLAPLHAAGFAVLAIDLRGHGRSTGAPEMRLVERVNERDKRLFQAMDRDVEAGFLWLIEQPGVDPARIALVGASVGASVALEYAARDKSVDAVVCLTPGTNYLEMDSLASAEKYGRRPLLLVAVEPEKSATEQIGRVSAASQVKIYPADDATPQSLHGTRMLGKVPGIEKEVVSFLEKSVGSPSREPVVASLKGQVYYAAESSMASRLSKRNVRWFTSPAEAEERGLRAPRTPTRRGSRSSKPKVAPEGESFPE